MSLKQWAVTTAAKRMMKAAEEDGKVAEAVVSFDTWVKGTFPDDPSGMKYHLVRHILFPFSKLLMGGDARGLDKAKEEAL